MQIHLTEQKTHRKLGSYDSEIIPRKGETITINTRLSNDDGETEQFAVTEVEHFLAAEEYSETLSPFFVSIRVKAIL